MGLIKWTEDVLEDMKVIHEYISKDSIVYADRLLDNFYNRVQLLTAQPDSGRIVPEKNDPYIREVFEGSYRIMYTTSFLPDIIILRIIRFSQQFK
ncbi:type II toxin-antitoxin system RelE/ParE family toxin [Chitinophagaceae bacterium MMS25-I14]